MLCHGIQTRTILLLLAAIMALQAPRPAQAEGGLEATFEIAQIDGAADSPGPDRPRAPRQLIFLVDYSGSMSKEPAGKFGMPNQTRWDAVKAKVEAHLKRVWAQDPSVRVTIRFFHGGVDAKKKAGLIGDPLPSPIVLDGKKDENFRFPKNPDGANQTALHKAIISTCGAIVNQFRGGQMPDWVALVVVADGEDSNQLEADKREWPKALDRLKTAIPGCVTGVLPVGPQAEEMFEKGGFGDLQDCSELPKPPPPRKRYEIRAAKATINLDRPMADAGANESVAIKIVGQLPAGWSFMPVVLPATSGSLVGSPTLLSQKDPSGSATIVSRVSDPASAGVISIRLDAKALSDLRADGPLVIGTPQLEFRFRPAEVPTEPSKWRVVGRSPLRIDEVGQFTTTIGNAKDIDWLFRGPPGSKQFSARGTSVSFDGSRGAGLWMVDLKATSSDGKSREGKEVTTFEVVDSRVGISGPAEGYAGTQVTFVAREGPSPANLQWFVDGEEQPQARGKGALDFTPDDVRAFSIMCVATSRVGSFEFNDSAKFVAKIAPGVICQDASQTIACLEIDQQAFIPLKAIDVQKIEWKVGDRRQPDRPVTFEPGAKPICDVVLPVDVAALKPDVGGMSEPARIPITWSGVDKKGARVGEGSVTLVINPVRFSISMVAPAAGKELLKGEEHQLQVRSELSPIEGLNETELATRLAGLAAKVEFELLDASGEEISSLKQPPQTIKDGVVSITVKLPESLAGDTLSVRARVLSDKLIYPTKWQPLGNFPLSLGNSNHSIAEIVPFKAYSRLNIKLDGLRAGESIQWTIRQADGKVVHQWSGDKATDAVDGLPKGLPRGTYSINASVTRADGSSQPVPARDFIVESSVTFDLDPWRWEDGSTRPVLEGELRGDPAELHDAAMEWESCVAAGMPSAGNATCSVTPIEGTRRYRINLPPETACGSVPTVTVKGTVKWPSALPLKIEETATLTFKPTTDFAVEPTLMVGGKADSGYGGGVITAPFPGISGPYCPGSVEMQVTYVPDLSGGSPRTFIQRIDGDKPSGWIDRASGEPVPNIESSPSDTGTWSLVTKVQRPDQPTPLQIGPERSFTQTKQPNWLKAGLILVAGMAAAMLIVKVGRGNKALWISVKPLMTPQHQHSLTGRIRPTIWPWSRKRPWFNLWHKSAELPLVRESGRRGLIPKSAIGSYPGLGWLMDNSPDRPGSEGCSTTVLWDDGLRLKDDRRELQGEESQNIRSFQPVLYPGSDFGSTELKPLRLWVIRPSPSRDYTSTAMAYSLALLVFVYSAFAAAEWL